ncbi:MAG: MMPL family transporter [Nanoarchaeota archaeon]|nr:MMPL family transporter [Nanoarchaeota archaeon]
MKLLKPILQKITHFQVKFPVFTILIILGFTIMIWGGASKVQTVASLELMMPSTISEIEAINTLRDAHLGKDGLVILLSVDENSQNRLGNTHVLNYEVMQYLLFLQESLEQESSIIRIESIVSYMKYNEEFMSISSQEEFEEMLQNNQNPYFQEQFEQLKHQFISKDSKKTLLFIETDIGRDDESMQLFIEKVKAIVQNSGLPSNIVASYTGTPVIQQELGFLVNQDRENTQLVSLLLVFIITSIVFRSLTTAIMPLLVVFVSVNWLYGTMGYFNLPISTLAGGVAAMVVGIGIAFAIHIMNKFKLERKNGNSIPESIELAVVQTGSALIATSLTTIGAFLAFFAGVMPEMGSFGLLMAIGIFYALFFSIIGLPALLIIEEKILYYIKEKARFGIDNEYHLEGGEKIQ